MISYQITIQEIIDILMDPYKVSNELLFWIRYKRYPVITLYYMRDAFLLEVWFQEFNTNNSGKWWIPIRLISKPSSFESTLSRNISNVLSSKQPFFFTTYTTKEDWIMIDNQQAGKYVPQHYLYIFYVIILR